MFAINPDPSPSPHLAPDQIMFAFNAYAMSDNQQRNMLRASCRGALLELISYDTLTTNTSTSACGCAGVCKWVKEG